MKVDYEILQANTPFERSHIWQLNRYYYQTVGLSAWSEGVVPHNMTSNANVGKTYAALILGFLKDLANKGEVQEKVFIVELGAGHGRLGYHILKQLDEMIALEPIPLPPYCYVLTDIVESNLNFFQEHPQFQSYFNSGRLDVAYFDGSESHELYLKNHKQTLSHHSLKSPIIAIANYFFDSLPTELYRIKKGKSYAIGLSLKSFLKEGSVAYDALLKNIKSTLHISPTEHIEARSLFIAQLLDQYKSSLKKTHILIPRIAIQCIETIRQFSQEGLMLISMDKGTSALSELEGRSAPEIIKHGSISLYVNFHALDQYCISTHGKAMFSDYSDYSMQLGCFLFMSQPEEYATTIAAYEHYVNDFGPDDYNGLKKMIYRLIDDLSLRELITSLRLGGYDSTLFLRLLPYIKEHLKTLNVVDRNRLSQTLTKVDNYYFDINETINVSYELAGLFYDIGLYQQSLDIYNRHTDDFAESADVYYNKILCCYQLRLDQEFRDLLLKAKNTFPDFTRFADLDELDLDV